MLLPNWLPGFWLKVVSQPWEGDVTMVLPSMVWQIRKAISNPSKEELYLSLKQVCQKVHWPQEISLHHIGSVTAYSIQQGSNRLGQAQYLIAERSRLMLFLHTFATRSWGVLVLELFSVSPAGRGGDVAEAECDPGGVRHRADLRQVPGHGQGGGGDRAREQPAARLGWAPRRRHALPHPLLVLHGRRLCAFGNFNL